MFPNKGEHPVLPGWARGACTHTATGAMLLLGRRQASSVPSAGVGQWLLRGMEVRDVSMGDFLEEVSIQWSLEGLMEEELTQRR